jgi:DNA-binding LacI/PurR family transcriptional regulator
MANLKDIAQQAGVDPSTVSRVLNGDAISVRPETRARILQAAEQLDYVPNAMARSLRTRRSRTLGLLVPDISNPFFPEVIYGAEGAARRAGYHVIVGNTDETFERELEYVEVLRAQRVDGIILATAFTEDRLVPVLARKRVPFVLVNRAVSGTTHYVAVDDRALAAMAVRHLADLGHRRIAHITGPLFTATGIGRFHGYRQALNDLGLPFHTQYVREGNFRLESGYQEARALLHLDEPPTAVFAANDLVALGVMEAARDAGLDVPAELSVVGVNDIPLVSHLTPPLTTIHVPTREMGEASVEMLLGLLEGRYPSAPTILPVSLVVRGSTAPVRRAASPR